MSVCVCAGVYAGVYVWVCGVWGCVGVWGCGSVWVCVCAAMNTDSKTQIYNQPIIKIVCSKTTYNIRHRENDKLDSLTARFDTLKKYCAQYTSSNTRTKYYSKKGYTPKIKYENLPANCRLFSVQYLQDS